MSLTLALFAQLALASPTIIDADTLRAKGETYRLAGIDAPEIGGNAGCPAERALGEAAAARVRELVKGGEVRAIPADTPKAGHTWATDRYNRRLARIEIDGMDLGETLIREGLAVIWEPGAKHDWCLSTPSGRTSDH